MNRNETILVAAIVGFILLVAWSSMNQSPGDGGSGGTGAAPTPSPQPTNAPYYPYPTAPPSESVGNAPSSLMISVEPNPLPMGNTAYGEVVSDGYSYPITIHAKHVGSGDENSFGARLDEDGMFWHSQALNVPGYYDFWATADNGVSSNTPRLTVQGALLLSDDVFFSRIMEDYTANLRLFCHSAGTATVYARNTATSAVSTVGTTHINSGGYGAYTLNVAGWSLGNYDLYFTVNGITCATVYITYGR